MESGNRDIVFSGRGGEGVFINIDGKEGPRHVVYYDCVSTGNKVLLCIDYLTIFSTDAHYLYNYRFLLREVDGVVPDGKGSNRLSVGRL